MILQVPDHYLDMLEEEAENTMTELQTFLPLLGSVQLMDTDPDQVSFIYLGFFSVLSNITI